MMRRLQRSAAVMQSDCWGYDGALVASIAPAASFLQAQFTLVTMKETGRRFEKGDGIFQRRAMPAIGDFHDFGCRNGRGDFLVQSGWVAWSSVP